MTQRRENARKLINAEIEQEWFVFVKICSLLVIFSLNLHNNAVNYVYRARYYLSSTFSVADIYDW